MYFGAFMIEFWYWLIFESSDKTIGLHMLEIYAFLDHLET